MSATLQNGYYWISTATPTPWELAPKHQEPKLMVWEQVDFDHRPGGTFEIVLDNVTGKYTYYKISFSSIPLLVKDGQLVMDRAGPGSLFHIQLLDDGNYRINPHVDHDRETTTWTAAKLEHGTPITLAPHGQGFQSWRLDFQG